MFCYYRGYLYLLSIVPFITLIIINVILILPAFLAGETIVKGFHCGKSCNHTLVPQL